MGEWITRDPIGYDGGISLYQYVNGSPELYVDPFGKEGEGCSMCCCCVENLKLLSVIAKNTIKLPDTNNAKKTVTSRFDGYEVKVQVDLEYKLDENYSLDCTLKWYEWMTPKPLLPGEPTETWIDRYATMSKSPTFDGWNKKERACPGKPSKPAIITDPPGIGNPDPVYDQIIHFGIRVLSTCKKQNDPEKDCKNDFKDLFFTVRLSRQGGPLKRKFDRDLKAIPDPPGNPPF